MKKKYSREIIVFIDTSMLRAMKEFKSHKVQALFELSKKGIVSIKMPYIVKEEYISHLESQKKDLVNKIKNNDCYRFLKSVKYNLLEIVNVLKLEELNVESYFEKWCKENNIELLPLDSTFTAKVFESYFKGHSPFEKQKSRKDIPDAFIFEEIKSFKKSEHLVCILVRDRNLKKHCEDAGILTFDSFEMLLQNEEIQHYIVHRKKKELPNELLKYLDEIEDFVSEKIIDVEINKSLSGLEIDLNKCNDYIYDNANIQYIESPEQISILFEQQYYLSEDEIAIPIILLCAANIDIFIFRSDYYAQIENVSAYEWNEHYFISEEQIYIQIKTELLIKTDKLEYQSLDIQVNEENLFELLEINISNNYEVKNVFCNGYFSFKCDKCHKTHIVNCDILDWQEVDRRERQMGIEIYYQAQFYETCICDNHIEINFSCWEYPKGTLNHFDVEATGGSNKVFKCTYNICDKIS